MGLKEVFYARTFVLDFRAKKAVSELKTPDRLGPEVWSHPAPRLGPVVSRVRVAKFDILRVDEGGEVALGGGLVEHGVACRDAAACWGQCRRV